MDTEKILELVEKHYETDADLQAALRSALAEKVDPNWTMETILAQQCVLMADAICNRVDQIGTKPGDGTQWLVETAGKVVAGSIPDTGDGLKSVFADDPRVFDVCQQWCEDRGLDIWSKDGETHMYQAFATTNFRVVVKSLIQTVEALGSSDDHPAVGDDQMEEWTDEIMRAVSLIPVEVGGHNGHPTA